MAILTTTKLAIYNGALRRLGSRKLASLSENRKPRRVLDDIWGDSDNVISRCLRQADWNFATRTTVITYLTAVEPEFGFRRAFAKPDDILRLSSLCGDEYMNEPLTAHHFTEEAGYYFSDLDQLYLKYVSSDGSYGFDDTKWHEDFKTYVECLMAFDACEVITNSTSKKVNLAREMKEAMRDSVSANAMADGVKFPPAGSWVRSRGQPRRERSRLG